MIIFSLKNWMLSLGLLAACAGPDELVLGYGHQFADDGSIEAWPVRNGDSDFVTVSLVWKLQPTKVEVINPVVPQVRWVLEPVPEEQPQEPTPAPAQQTPTLAPVEEPQAPDPEHSTTDDVGGAVQAYDKLDWITRVLLLVAVCWLGWVYREKLGRLIPGNGRAKGNSK